MDSYPNQYRHRLNRSVYLGDSLPPTPFGFGVLSPVSRHHVTWLSRSSSPRLTSTNPFGSHNFTERRDGFEPPNASFAGKCLTRLGDRRIAGAHCDTSGAPVQARILGTSTQCHQREILIYYNFSDCQGVTFQTENELGWNVIHQPYSVRGSGKGVSRFLHSVRVNRENDGLTVTGADLLGRFPIF